MLEVPVVLLIHKRARQTRAVLERVLEADPSRILVVADGPASAADAAACHETRKLVIDACSPAVLETCFAERNLGCANRVSSGLDWAFSRVDRAIVLEDDCVPDPTFFRYCAELLDVYEHDERIMHIAGTSLAEVPTGSSYTFSRFLLPPWGWATWRRAWRSYDFSMQDWDSDRELVREIVAPEDREIWEFVCEYNRQYRVTWDLQWNLSIWRSGGLGLVPTQNLVSNIGYGSDATHTKRVDSDFARRSVRSAGFPLRHPAGSTPEIDRELGAALARWLRENRESGIAEKLAQARMG